MTTLEAIFLGLIQGVTEFLPVSSSGHLVLSEWILAFDNVPVSYYILLHAATLIAVVVYFRKQLKNISKGELGLLFVGSLPAGLVGLVFKNPIQTYLFRPEFAVVGLIFTGFVLLLSRWHKSDSKSKMTTRLTSITYQQALIIGLAQAIAIMPGVSRSGTSVVAGLLLGLSPQQAFTFSFLLSIPAISGATLLSLDQWSAYSLNPVATLSGLAAALIVGLISLQLLDRMIKRQKLWYFSIYCFILAIGVGTLLWTK